VALSDVYDELGGRFGYINAAAAITTYAKSRVRGSNAQLLTSLLRCWLQLLPDARMQACANVLWALGRLDARLGEVWEPTFEAYLRLVQQDVQSQSCNHQQIANVLWAANTWPAGSICAGCAVAKHAGRCKYTRLFQYCLGIGQA
jgi:hypothetical protein